MTPLLLAAAAAAASPAPSRDWAAAARGDLLAFHAAVAADHPGAVNREDAGFNARERRALGVALARAAQARDAAGYRFALAGYAASFDDGHLAFAASDALPPPPARWPGFLTALDPRGRPVVAVTAAGSPVAKGARLVSCDGRPADRLAAENLGTFEGRWALESVRVRRAPRLFADEGNPYIRRPARCVFEQDDRRTAVTLAWRDVPPVELRARVRAAFARAYPPIGARVLADGTRWYALSDFDGDPSSAAGRALPGLIAGMRADRAALSAAPAIVLDLRGNNGGSSDWSRQVAVILWGKAAVADAERRTASDAVDWRASAANLATIEAARAAQRTVASPDMLAWFDRTAAGLRDALAAGRPLWRDPAEADPAGDDPAGGGAAGPGTGAAPPPLRGPVWFVTDEGCGSACLDAADLWAAAGAVQVGRETSADTLYMDVRHQPLPSGLGDAVIPMKVYRGRARGPNVPLRPVHAYPGDLADTAALERWVATLPR